MKLKPINIIVNGKPCRVWESELTWEEVADLADIPISEQTRKDLRLKSKIAVKEGCTINIKKI